MLRSYKLDITPILLHGYGNAIRKNDFLIKRSIVSYKVLPRISCDDTEVWHWLIEIEARELRTISLKHSMSSLKKERDANYLYGNIRANIDYKGAIVEWYYKVKWRLERDNYAYYDTYNTKQCKDL